MIRQKFLPTVQPSSVQKNENKENQYQMQRDPLNSATHTKTKQHQQWAKKHTSRTTKWNKNKKDEKTSQSETGTQRKNKKQKGN